MKVTLFVVLAFALAVSAQSLVRRGALDNFTLGANQNGVAFTTQTQIQQGDQPIAFTDSFNSAGCNQNALLGCGRDIYMEVTESPVGRQFTSTILTSYTAGFSGEWTLSNPKNAKSVTFLQYDGLDGTINRNLNGLGNVDLTSGGLASQFRFSVVTDLQTTFNTFVFSPDGSLCENILVVQPTPQQYNVEDTFFNLPFSSFTGGCSFTNAGCIEIEVPSSDAVDAIVREVSILGLPDPTPTPTPSPSRTPTPAPSGTDTPSRTPTPTGTRTPSPSGPCIFVCACPEFTCQLQYETDDFFNTVTYYRPYFVYDDEDNGGGIIYVVTTVFDFTTVIYYVFSTITYTIYLGSGVTFTNFFTFTDFFSFTGATFTGFFTISGNSGSSAAGTLVAPVVAIVAAAFFA